MLLFPCNQFGLQEPGKNSEILNGLKYVRPGGGYEPHENMTIYGKLKVNGNDAHPMYQFLKDACPPTSEVITETSEMFWTPVRINDLVWNFEKFVVDREGRPRYRFHPAAWNDGKLVEPYLKQVLDEGRGFDAIRNDQESLSSTSARESGFSFPWKFVQTAFEDST